MFSSSKTDPEAALVKRMGFFSHPNTAFQFSLSFFKGMWFSFAFSGTEEDMGQGCTGGHADKQG